MPNRLTPVSSEFLVNQFSVGDQDDSQILALTGPGGPHFSVLWEGREQSGTQRDILVRSFDEDGTALGSETRVTASSAFDQTDPAVAQLSGGQNVVVWEDSRGSGEIWARIGPTSGGTATNPFSGGTEVRLMAQSGQRFINPEITALNDGGFAVAATRTINGAEVPVLQLYSAAGAAEGGRQLLYTGTGEAYAPSVVALDNGNILTLFAVETRNAAGQPTGLDLYSRLYSGSTGQALEPAQRLTNPDELVDFPSLTKLADGRILATGRQYFEDNTVEIAAVFGADGSPPNTGTQITDRPVDFNYDVSVAATPDGGFVAVWTVENASGSDAREIAIRRFDVDLDPISASEIVNTLTTGPQLNADVAILPTGEVLVTWDSDDLVNNDAENVRAQVYTLDPLGDPGITRTGTSGNDSLVGTAGDDTLIGGDGRDRLLGGDGYDTMQGGRGNDIYFVDSLGDVISGEIGFAAGGGIDTIFTSVNLVQPENIELIRLSGFDDLNATGNDAPGTLVGNAGENRLTGRGGNDQINGNGGNDVMIGNTGRDTLVGGAGDDTFVYTAYADSRAGAANRDVINGFDRTAAADDVIDLSAMDANTRTFGVDDAFTFVGTARFSGQAGELRMQGLGGANAVLVEGDHNGDGQADFQIFVNLTNFMTGTDFIL